MSRTKAFSVCTILKRRGLLVIVDDIAATVSGKPAGVSMMSRHVDRAWASSHTVLANGKSPPASLNALTARTRRIRPERAES